VYNDKSNSIIGSSLRQYSTLLEPISLWVLLFLGVSIAFFSILSPKLIAVNVPKSYQAERVMIFPPVLWHYLTIDSNDSHILAIPKYIKDEAKENLLASLFPSIALKDEALTSIGAIPLGVEQIMLLNPDRILMWEQFSQRLDNVYFQGMVKLSYALFNDKTRLYTVLGEITHHQNRSAYLIDRDTKSIQMILEHIPKESPEISVVVIGNKDNFSLWGSQFKRFNQILSFLHVNNSASKNSLNGATNIETLLMLDPAVIFIPSYSDHPLTPDEIYHDPRFFPLKAIQNRRVYVIPKGITKMEGPAEEPLLIMWLANILYPELQPFKALRHSIVETYQEVYGYTPNDTQIDELLHIQQNSSSQGYEIFLKEPYVTTF